MLLVFQGSAKRPDKYSSLFLHLFIFIVSKIATRFDAFLVRKFLADRVLYLILLSLSSFICCFLFLVNVLGTWQEDDATF